MNNKVPFSKPWLSIEDQLRKLEGRGLVVVDRPTALRKLRYINYYRFSGYALPFQSRDPATNDRVFTPGTTFDDVWSLCVFDCNLRDVCSEALEMIEISLRASIAHCFAETHGAFGHTNVANFNVDFSRPNSSPTSQTNAVTPYNSWQKTLLAETNRSSEIFVKHFKQNYTEYPNLPIWVVSELCSFGTLSRMYSNMLNIDQGKIAAQYGLQYRVLASWMHVLTYARNICAHHSRLWDKTLQISPTLPLRKNWQKMKGGEKTLFALILMINWMLTHDSIDPADHRQWKIRLEKLMDAFATAHPSLLPHTGFPSAWKKNPLWWQY